MSLRRSFWRCTRALAGPVVVFLLGLRFALSESHDLHVYGGLAVALIGMTWFFLVLGSPERGNTW